MNLAGENEKEYRVYLTWDEAKQMRDIVTQTCYGIEPLNYKQRMILRKVSDWFAAQTDEGPE